jgi:hypothetical protein
MNFAGEGGSEGKILVVRLFLEGGRRSEVTVWSKQGTFTSPHLHLTSPSPHLYLTFLQLEHLHLTFISPSSNSNISTVL